MMRIIIDENLYDADYVAKYTHGFDELKQRVREPLYGTESVAQITGIPADDIRKLAREYATVTPSVIRMNYGIQRCENGGMAARAVTMLPCLIGSWKHVGGGLQLSTSGAFPFDKDSLTRPDLMQKSPLKRAARVINMSEIGRVLTTLTDDNKKETPAKAVFVYNSNPVAVAPNHNDVLRGFSRPDLFTVVHEQFFTDTTDYADVLLPATTFFEHKELQGSYGHYYVQVSNQAIEALGECKSNVDLFRELALRFGFDKDEPSFRQSVDEMIDGALASGHKWFKGITRERLETEKHIRMNFNGNVTQPTAEEEPFLPYANGGFPTPTGKAEFYTESLKKQGLDPIACFIPPTESRHNRDKAKQYPLEMLARKADNHLNSTFCNIPAHQKMEESHLLEISTADAAKRGIKDGDAVRVFNSRGEINLTARVDGTVRAGVVASRLNWAKLTPGGKNINVLTAENLTEIGAGATFYSCLVEVEKSN
jgi:anaerobic selenocysteine-containing dehydrogenase